MVYNYLSYLILFRKKSSLNELLFIFHTVSVWTEAGNRPSFLDTQDYCKSAIKILIRQDFAPPFISTFCSTSNGNILPFCPRPGKTKNPDSTWESEFYCLLFFFKVVPPVLIQVALIFRHFLTKIIWLLIFSFLCDYL